MCCDPDEPKVDEEDYLACIPWGGNENTLPAPLPGLEGDILVIPAEL
jgi:hypothetical protein